MEFEKIMSGKNKVQIIDKGFRMQWNNGPKGPLKTTYFSCVEKGCKATLATMGDLDSDLTLKYHRLEQHNHRSDNATMLVSKTRNPALKNTIGAEANGVVISLRFQSFV